MCVCLCFFIVVTKASHFHVNNLTQNAGGPPNHFDLLLTKHSHTSSAFSLAAAMFSTCLVISVVIFVCFARGRHCRGRSTQRRLSTNHKPRRLKRRLANGTVDRDRLLIDAINNPPFVIECPMTRAPPPTPSSMMSLRLPRRRSDWTGPGSYGWTVSSNASGCCRASSIESRRLFEPVSTPLLLSWRSQDDDLDEQTAGLST